MLDKCLCSIHIPKQATKKFWRVCQQFGARIAYHLKHCDVGLLSVMDECNAFVQQYPNKSPGSSLPGPRSLRVAAEPWLYVGSGAPAASMDVKVALHSLICIGLHHSSTRVIILDAPILPIFDIRVLSSDIRRSSPRWSGLQESAFALVCNSQAVFFGGANPFCKATGGTQWELTPKFHLLKPRGGAGESLFPPHQL